MKDKIEPYCKWCKDEMCVYAECPACCDYCPVPNLPGVCRFEKREDMTPMKAWGNIADRLRIYAGEHGFTDEDMAAEVMAYRALSAAEEEREVDEGNV